MRKYAREIAFSSIYEIMIHSEGEVIDFPMFTEHDLTEEDKLFAQQLVDGTNANAAELKEQIGSYSKGFSLDRMYKIDLAILQLAFYEMKFTDTPAPIIINEAVDIAKKYSTDRSVGFVNGILSQFNRDLAKVENESNS